jgi:hypothetical protein
MRDEMRDEVIEEKASNGQARRGKEYMQHQKHAVSKESS